MSKIHDYIASKGYSSVMWGNDTEGSTEKLSPEIMWTVYKPNCNEDIIKNELARGRRLINSKNTTY